MFNPQALPDINEFALKLKKKKKLKKLKLKFTKISCVFSLPASVSFAVFTHVSKNYVTIVV